MNVKIWLKVWRKVANVFLVLGEYYKTLKNRINCNRVTISKIVFILLASWLNYSDWVFLNLIAPFGKIE